MALLALGGAQARSDVSRFAALDDGIVWEGKVYFFRGGEYVRYDMDSDRSDPGYPKPLRGAWGLPEAFFGGIDACVMGEGTIAYLLKGSNYIRYDMDSDQTDGVPRPIAGNWPGLNRDFASGIDAGFRWKEKAYLFKGPNYVRYDMEEDRADDGYPLPTAKYWSGLPPAFALGIDAAVPWSDKLVYLFRGAYYVRYDMEADRVEGTVQAIADRWPGLGRPASPALDVGTLTVSALTAYFSLLRKNVLRGSHSAPNTSEVALQVGALRLVDPLAAKQLEAVFSALLDLERSSQSSTLRNTQVAAEARRACGIGSGEWCGAFLAKCYSGGGLAAPWRYQFQGTQGLPSYAQYVKAVDPNAANKPTHVVLPSGRVPIKDYHTQRGSLRVWNTGATFQAELASGRANLRTGDILLVGGSAHIQMVLHWDATSRLLYTIDGNGGSYEWDRRTEAEHLLFRDPTGAAAERLRSGLEAIAGVPVWRKPEGGGHVGIGVRDMSIATERASVNSSIRPSLVDFEPLTYATL